MNHELEPLTGRHNFFEDFAVGDIYEHARGKTVEALENVLITNLVLNTAQAHFNEHLAASLPQGHRITFGGVTASLVIGLAMEDTGENAVRELGLDQVRFRVPVLHGDTLYAFSEVLKLEAEPPETYGYENVGVIHFRHWGVNQRGETVFEGERRVLVKKRGFVTGGLEFDDPAPLARPTSRSVPKQRLARVKPATRSRAKTPARGRARANKQMAVKAKPVKPRGGR